MRITTRRSYHWTREYDIVELNSRVGKKYANRHLRRQGKKAARGYLMSA